MSASLAGVRRDAGQWWHTNRARARAVAAALSTPTGWAADRILVTVLFTDIVDSTRLAAELGDRRWGHLLSQHDEIVRRELLRHGGREVKTLGDGFMAAFAAPAQAIRCAGAIEGALRPLGLAVRAGLHCGECDRDGDDLRGIAVNIAARVAALARAGEVAVTSTVKDVVAGTEFVFADRGAHRLRGVPGEWRVFRATA